MNRRNRLHRCFLAVFLLAQLGGFHGEDVSGTRRAVEILSGQKSVALVPKARGVVAAFGSDVTANA
ncbi:hypothetical protein E3C22_03535 [Jiella endophytica]|uniref:Uncharacterized protein n=1 Tax=Jiella endophytica TaxID=2558362 RepID=A0A4Y8RUV7_9HYPH|nr:hypothetical protein [Jiella endophytica]TFF27542.1 hypothetical protein E3C22_03535 [Jiella endophytica]